MTRVLLLLSLPAIIFALDNGLARLPPMGWMTWERFRCTAGESGTGPSCASDPENCISDKLVRQHADILGQPEWRSLGYDYHNIDGTECPIPRNPKLVALILLRLFGRLLVELESHGRQAGSCAVASAAHVAWLTARLPWELADA